MIHHESTPNVLVRDVLLVAHGLVDLARHSLIGFLTFFKAIPILIGIRARRVFTLVLPRGQTHCFIA